MGTTPAPPIGGSVVLESATTKTASFSATPRTMPDNVRELVVTLDITVADHADGDETYDLYITCSDGISSWDLIHFPQIITTGAKRYTAKVQGLVLPQTVVAAGTSTNDAVLRTETAGSAQGIKTLAAGAVRHGAIGCQLGYELVVGGTTPSLSYSIRAIARG